MSWLSCFIGGHALASGNMSEVCGMRFIVANSRFLCHKPAPDRPADQGLPWRYTLLVLSILEKS
jgi:hypothetical protein